MKFVLFIYLLIELIATFVLVSRLGFLATLAFMILSGFVGSIILRFQGFQVLTEVAHGPSALPVDRFAKAFAGLLLMVPGVIVKIIALLLFVPGIRQALAQILASQLRRQNSQGTTVFVTTLGSSPRRPPVRDVTPLPTSQD